MANLRFGKELETIAALTSSWIREAQQQYAALSPPPGVWSGPHEASIARIQMQGAEEIIHRFERMWVELISKRNGPMSRQDVAIITEKLRGNHATSRKKHQSQCPSSKCGWRSLRLEFARLVTPSSDRARNTWRPAGAGFGTGRISLPRLRCLRPRQTLDHRASSCARCI